MTAATLVLLSPPCATTAAWSRVTPFLDERGVSSISVQLPAMLPTSELDDSTFLRRFLDDLEEPVVLVGHSSGGWELTEVGAHPAVKHLVYVDAVVPTSASPWPTSSTASRGSSAGACAWTTR